MAYCVVPNSFVYISYNPDILLLASNCIICWMAGIRNRMFVSLLPVVTTLSDDKLGSYLIGEAISKVLGVQWLGWCLSGMFWQNLVCLPYIKHEKLACVYKHKQKKQM